MESGPAGLRLAGAATVMALLRLALVLLPLVGIVILTWRRWHSQHAPNRRSIFRFSGLVLATSIGATMLGAGVGMNLFCRFSDSNLCGVGGLLIGGFGGAYLGGLGACLLWYRRGRPESGG